MLSVPTEAKNDSTCSTRRSGQTPLNRRFEKKSSHFCALWTSIVVLVKYHHLLQVYERTCAQLVRAVLDGYNACCFAYGATGGGKTHTMVGTHEEPGCMVKALNELFRAMDENHDFTFRVSKLRSCKYCLIKMAWELGNEVNADCFPKFGIGTAPYSALIR